jgi:predicted methyltransferase
MHMHKRGTTPTLSHRAGVNLLVLAALIAATCYSIEALAQDYSAILAAPDRSEADRQTDQRREPAKLLGFSGVRLGAKVLDIGAAGGYSTELLARAVGPSGVVYAVDSAAVADRTKEKFEARTKNPVMKPVIRLIRNYDDPLPPEVRDLDLITFLFFYHDTTYMDVDRAKMNRKLFEALKPGGFLIIADHSAKPGEAISVGKTLHRIDEGTLRQEIEAAGFKLVEQGDFLHHPDDPRDVPVFHPKVPVDEFVLKYQKPVT